MPAFATYVFKLAVRTKKRCFYFYSTASMYLLDMVKDYITRTRASIKGAVQKARDTAGRGLVV
jgi:hypothetical protein